MIASAISGHLGHLGVGELACLKHLVPDGETGRLDPLIGMFAVGLDAGSDQALPGFMADLGAEHHLAAGQGADGLLQTILLSAALQGALTIGVDLAQSDEPDARAPDLIDEKLARLTEMDAEPSLVGRDRHQNRSAWAFSVLRGTAQSQRCLLSGDLGAQGGAAGLSGSEQLSGRLDCPKLLGGWSTLTGQTIKGPMLGCGDERHAVVQEGPLGADDLRDLGKVHIIDPRDQHRVDLDQDTPGNQALESLLLLFNQDLCSCAPTYPAMFPKDPGIDLSADVRVETIDGDRHVLDAIAGVFDMSAVIQLDA